MTLDVTAEDVATTADEILRLADEETPSTTDGEAAPDVEEAQAAEDTPDSEEVSDDGPDQEAQEEPKPAGRSQKLQKLIDSKGGDEEKFAESMYQQMNSAAALAKKVADLEERLQNTEEATRVPEPVEPHPDVVAIQQDIEALNAEAEGIRSRKHLILVDLGKLEKHVAYLEGQALKADEYDKNVLANEKFQYSQLIRALESEYRQLETREPRLTREFRDAKRQLDAANQKVEAERAYQRNRALESRAYSDNFKTRFEAKVSEMSGKLGIPEGSREYVLELAKAKASVFLRGLPQESPGLHEDKDIETFVGAVLAKYVEDRGLVKKGQFTKLSKAKLQTTAAPAPANKPTIKSPMPDAPKTAKEANSPQFWKNRAARILG